MHKVHPLAWQSEPTDFVTTHCMKCEASFARKGTGGGQITICLIDRELVLPNMTDCNRYEPKEEKRPAPKRAPHHIPRRPARKHRRRVSPGS